MDKVCALVRSELHCANDKRNSQGKVVARMLARSRTRRLSGLRVVRTGSRVEGYLSVKPAALFQARGVLVLPLFSACFFRTTKLHFSSADCMSTRIAVTSRWTTVSLL